MKKALLILTALVIAVLCRGQVPDAEMQKIFKKLELQQQLTQAEQKKLTEWSEQMANTGRQIFEEEEENEEQYEDEDDTWNETDEDEGYTDRKDNPEIRNAIPPFGSECPKQLKSIPEIPELSQEQYLALVRRLMTGYGDSLGTKLREIRQMLMSSTRPTEGADMAALFLMSGSGSAAIYCAAWSAERAPQDILTANTLGVALKDIREFASSLQILRYADRIRPDVPVVIINMGWTCYEMGDAATAKDLFNRALRLDPELTAPHLGLGLLAECAGDHFTAMKHLKIALAGNYSAAGFAAYRQAKAASDAGAENSQADQPSAPRDKNNTGGVELPDLSVSEQPEAMMHMKMPVERFMTGLDRRISQLTNDLLSVSSTVSAQAARAHSNPDGAIVFNRDFANEIMMFDDMTVLLFGPDSNFGMALTEGQNDCERVMESVEDNAGTISQDLEKFNRLMDEKNRHMEICIEKMEACGDNEACFKKAEADAKAAMDPIDRELEQVNYRLCKNTKRGLDMTIGCQSRYYTKANNAFRPAVYDYYAFTDPILERIYSPSYNEMLNLQREIRVLSFQKALAGTALSLADMSEGYKSMTCVEPQPERPPKEIEEPELPKKDEKKCPLGDGIKAGFGGFSAELTCDHVTISGGEGLLGSVTRDFKTHQTKVWVGAGAKVEYGSGNLTGEATVGVEIVIGNNNTIDDMALTSSVKTGLGGLAEAEVSGRISLEGGPEIGATAGMTMPSIPGL